VVAALAGAALLALALALAAAALLELALALAAATTLLDDGLALAAVLEEGLTLAGMTLAAGPAASKVDACGLGPGEGEFTAGALRIGKHRGNGIRTGSHMDALVRVLLMQWSRRAEDSDRSETGTTNHWRNVLLLELADPEAEGDAAGLGGTGHDSSTAATVLSAVA
jgi:hypothetical protein